MKLAEYEYYRQTDVSLFAFHLVTYQALTTCRIIVKPTTFIQCRRFLKRIPCYDIPFALYILTIYNKMIHLTNNSFLRMLTILYSQLPFLKIAMI